MQLCSRKFWSRKCGCCIWLFVNRKTIYRKSHQNRLIQNIWIWNWSEQIEARDLRHKWIPNLSVNFTFWTTKTNFVVLGSHVEFPTSKSPSQAVDWKHSILDPFYFFHHRTLLATIKKPIFFKTNTWGDSGSPYTEPVCFVQIC